MEFLAVGLNDNNSSGSNNRHFGPYNKTDFPTFSNGYPRGWILKAVKVDAATMHLEGDALDLYSWLSNDQTIEL